MQQLLNSKHCSFPEQEVNDCHNRNDSDDYCSTVVCHYNKHFPPPDHVYRNNQQSRTAHPAATCNKDCSCIDHPQDNDSSPQDDDHRRFKDHSEQGHNRFCCNNVITDLLETTRRRSLPPQ